MRHSVKQRITRTGTDEPALAATLEETKAHLRQSEDHEDALIVSYINTASEWAEERTRRAIAQRSYLVVADRFPTAPWGLPLGKVQSITKIEYIDVDGATQTWTASPQEYEIDNDSDFQARLRPKPAFTWPTTGDFFSAARITLVAGWLPANVPFTIKQGILLKVASLYESRAPGDPEAETMEEAALTLLSGWTLPPF